MITTRKDKRLSANNHDPFGMLLVGRNWEGGSEYRYGFNGKESDKETYGDGNIYDYGFRIYNPRLGKFLSVDPLTKGYAWYTPYQFAGNKPIVAIDLDGLEEYLVHYIYNEHLEITKIRVSTYKNAKGNSQDMEIHKNNDHFQDRKVAVIHTYEKGLPVKDPTFQDALTLTQINILEKRIIDGSNWSESSSAQTGGNNWGGYKSKVFTSGYRIIAEVELQFTLDTKFEGSSDDFTSESEKVKIKDLGETMMIVTEATVELIGNSGTELGNPRKLPLGTGADALADPTSLDGRPVTTGELMKARAEAVGDVLKTDYGIAKDRISSKPGEVYDNPSGRNVQAKLNIPIE